MDEVDIPTYKGTTRYESYVWMASDKDVIGNPRLLLCCTGSLQWGNCSGPRSRSHIFLTCLYFSLPEGHFLRSQRNSADYISSTATFQGVGGSPTWAGRRRPEHRALRSDLGCLLLLAARKLGSCSPQPGEGVTNLLPRLDMIPLHRVAVGTKSGKKVLCTGEQVRCSTV